MIGWFNACVCTVVITVSNCGVLKGTIVRMSWCVIVGVA